MLCMFLAIPPPVQIPTILLFNPPLQTSPDSEAAFVPVLNIPRVDFPLRTESSFLLHQQRIPEKVLVFRDEIDLVGLNKAGLLSMTLVDHHILPRWAEAGAAPRAKLGGGLSSSTEPPPPVFEGLGSWAGGSLEIPTRFLSFWVS